MNYAEAQKIIATARCWTDGKSLGNNTRLECRFSHFAIRFHGTDILDIYPDGSYCLNSGGWRTATTKARLNEYLPPGFTVFSKDHEWFLDKSTHCQLACNTKGEVYEFQEGMTIGPRGGIKTKQLRKKGKGK